MHRRTQLAKLGASRSSRVCISFHTHTHARYSSRRHIDFLFHPTLLFLFFRPTTMSWTFRFPFHFHAPPMGLFILFRFSHDQNVTDWWWWWCAYATARLPLLQWFVILIIQEFYVPLKCFRYKYYHDSMTNHFFRLPFLIVLFLSPSIRATASYRLRYCYSIMVMFMQFISNCVASETIPRIFKWKENEMSFPFLCVSLTQSVCCVCSCELWVRKWVFFSPVK